MNPIRSSDVRPEMAQDEVTDLIRRILERRHPIDPATGLRIYNPGGHMIVNVDDLPPIVAPSRRSTDT